MTSNYHRDFQPASSAGRQRHPGPDQRLPSAAMTSYCAPHPGRDQPGRLPAAKRSGAAGHRLHLHAARHGQGHRPAVPRRLLRGHHHRAHRAGHQRPVRLPSGQSVTQPITDMVQAVHRIRRGDSIPGQRPAHRRAGHAQERHQRHGQGALRISRGDAAEHRSGDVGSAGDPQSRSRSRNVELDMAKKRAQEAARVKSEFLANMSHELRTCSAGSSASPASCSRPA